MDLENIADINDLFGSQPQKNTCRLKRLVQEFGPFSFAKKESDVLGLPNRHNYLYLDAGQSELTEMDMYKYSIVSCDELIAPFVCKGFFKKVDELTNF